MKFILSTHNVTLTKAIEDHVMTRIDKLENMDRYVTSVRVILDHDKTKAPDRQFSCSMRLSVHGPEIFATDSQIDLYVAIDLVCKKIQQQLRKRHSKYKAAKQKEGVRRKLKRQAAAGTEE